MIRGERGRLDAWLSKGGDENSHLIGVTKISMGKSTCVDETKG